MPPWDADPGFGPWKNDISLSDDEIAAITRWAASGAPRGDGDEPVFEQPAEQAEWSLGEPDWVYEFDAYDVTADGPGQLRRPADRDRLRGGPLDSRGGGPAR